MDHQEEQTTKNNNNDVEQVVEDSGEHVSAEGNVSVENNIQDVDVSDSDDEIEAINIQFGEGTDSDYFSDFQDEAANTKRVSEYAND